MSSLLNGTSLPEVWEAVCTYLRMHGTYVPSCRDLKLRPGGEMLRLLTYLTGEIA